ncbi:MAG: L,D-transpeptidase family protein [Pseudomonadota bacterium]
MDRLQYSNFNDGDAAKLGNEMLPNILARAVRAVLIVLCAGAFLTTSSTAQAQVTAFKQAVAEAAAKDADIAAFYRSTAFAPLWTGPDDVHLQRRAELLQALRKAKAHGLPASRYDPEGLLALLSDVRSARDRGFAEVALSVAYLQYARDIQTGVVIPKRIDKAIVREIPYRDRTEYLNNINTQPASAVFRALPPRSMEYNALLKEKVEMERLLANGGWGPIVPANKLEPGDQGPAVVALRNRLIRMGYLDRTNTRTFDADIESAVQQFQVAHALNVDGVAGVATMSQINIGVAKRLQSVLVALERERWFNTDRGKRHILVNIPDFTARIIDDGKVTFKTRSVVGAHRSGRHTPEFSDVMEHMIINPSWHVPRSIITKEYLPQLQNNPNAASHIIITDRAGRRVNRETADFSEYTARNFPYSMRQPPSRRNALGLVKFMFPNRHNIYLHDTPAKNLFSRDVRAFSHGCIRLAQPFDFAYTLLAAQTDSPVEDFQTILKTGRETQVDLEEHVPVHIIYRTAVTNARGHTEYRADVYGRDARIWDALSKAGVALEGVQG